MSTQDTREYVGSASGREPDDDADRPLRIIRCRALCKRMSGVRGGADAGAGKYQRGDGCSVHFAPRVRRAVGAPEYAF